MDPNIDHLRQTFCAKARSFVLASDRNTVKEGESFFDQFR